MLSSLHVSSLRLSRELPEDSYLKNLPVVRNLEKMGTLRFRSPVTFFVGENGVGKSTLIEAVAVNMGFNPEGGSLHLRFSTEDSHSPILMAYPGAEVLLLTDDGIQSVDYRETEHFQLTKRFLNAPEAMLRYLFEE